MLNRRISTARRSRRLESWRSRAFTYFDGLASNLNPADSAQLPNGERRAMPSGALHRLRADRAARSHSYLNIKHAQVFSDQEYWTVLRPNVELLKGGTPSPDPKFSNST
jgi:hypothetical protein